MDEPTESLLLRRISSGLAKTFNGFFCKQLVAQLQVVALTDLPGRKKAGNFGGEHPLHQDFDRLGGGRGFVLDGKAHVQVRFVMNVTGLWSTIYMSVKVASIRMEYSPK